MKRRICFALAICFLTVSGCQQPVKDEDLGAGEVVSLGKEHLIMKNSGHVMFLSVDETTKKNLEGLKNGDKIVLRGKQETVEVSPGRVQKFSEVYSIVKADGSHIALR